MNLSTINNSYTKAANYGKSAVSNKISEKFNEVLVTFLNNNSLTTKNVDNAQNKTVSEPTYNLTDEQTEYFKNKYGEDFVYGNENGEADHSNKFADYSDGDTREFFSELADVGAISKKDAEYASGKKSHGRVWVFEIINKNIDPLAPGNLRPMGNVSAAIPLVDPGFSLGEKYTWNEFGDKLIKSAEKFDNFRNNRQEYENFVKENHMSIDSIDPDYLPSLIRTFNLIKMMFE
jgi:hypothetical protein